MRHLKSDSVILTCNINVHCILCIGEAFVLWHLNPEVVRASIGLPDTIQQHAAVACLQFSQKLGPFSVLLRQFPFGDTGRDDLPPFLPESYPSVQERL